MGARPHTRTQVLRHTQSEREEAQTVDVEPASLCNFLTRFCALGYYSITTVVDDNSPTHTSPVFGDSSSLADCTRQVHLYVARTGPGQAIILHQGGS